MTLREDVERAIAGTVHVASEAAAAVDAVMAVLDRGDPAAAWDEGFEAGTEHAVALSAPPGPCGPADPPRNPYVRAPGAEAKPLAAAPPGDDTLPAWLAWRFRGVDEQAWNAMTEDDRLYFTHEADAVRRAVARGGFKTPPAGHEDEAATDDKETDRG